MSYAIESIAESIGARRVGKHKANIDWLLTDSRSLSFPEETLFFSFTTKRNSGARYIPELYDRGVRNFVITEEDFKLIENGELKTRHSQFSILNSLLSARSGSRKRRSLHRRGTLRCPPSFPVDESHRSKTPRRPTSTVSWSRNIPPARFA